MSEPQAHHCMTSEQRTWLLCNMSITPAARIKSINPNEDADFRLFQKY